MLAGCVTCLLALLFSSSEVHLNPAPLKVLFIGNSYTYYHRLPDIVSAMAARPESPRHFEVRMIAQGGASLSRHWNEGGARRALRSGKWDVVVLQEQSLGPLNQPQDLARYAARFADEARAAGARVVLYATWARRDQPETQIAIDEAYAAAARAGRSEMAPVGAAWQMARSRWPDIALHDDDGSHPSQSGSYLAACVIYIAVQHGAGACPALGEADRDDSRYVRLRAVAAETVATSSRRAGPTQVAPR